MPSYEVEIQRTVVHTAKITVTAKDEDAAQAKVEKIYEKFETYDKFEKTNKVEWELESEDFEINDVNEE